MISTNSKINFSYVALLLACMVAGYEDVVITARSRTSSPCAFAVTWAGFASRTRRTISPAVTCRDFGLGSEGSETDLGHLGVGTPTGELVVENRRAPRQNGRQG
jgi:hypothetical protein